MYLNDWNLLIIILLLLSLTFIINLNNSLFYLLIAEVMWIVLYSLILYIGYFYNNISFLSLTFFFLLISAIEFSIGIIIIFLQFLLLRTLNIDTNKNNFNYFFNNNNSNFKLFL